jgi:hypothetical protein
MPTKKSAEYNQKLKVGLFFATLLFCALFLPCVLPVAEPARIVFLGVGLVVLAIGGRRAWSGKPIGTSAKSLSVGESASHISSATIERAQQ